MQTFAFQMKLYESIIDNEGYQSDLQNWEGILCMEFPVTSDELFEFVPCSEWMSACLPKIHKKMDQLKDMVEAAYNVTGNWKNASLKKVLSSKKSWSTTHGAVFRDIQKILKAVVNFTHINVGHVISIFIYAAKIYWAGVVIQSKRHEQDKEVEKRQPEPQRFCGSTQWHAHKVEIKWEGSLRNYNGVWKMSHVVWVSISVRIFTGHRNQLHVMAPWALRLKLPPYVLSEIPTGQCSIPFDLVIEQRDRNRNILVDILTWWSKHQPRKELRSSVTERYFCIVPSVDERNKPMDEEVRKPQQVRDLQSNWTMDRIGMIRDLGNASIPEQATVFKLKSLIQGHCSTEGYREKESMRSLFKAEFEWTDLKMDADEFVQRCLHCMIFAGWRYNSAATVNCTTGETT